MEFKVISSNKHYCVVVKHLVWKEEDIYGILDSRDRHESLYALTRAADQKLETHINLAQEVEVESDNDHPVFKTQAEGGEERGASDC